MKLKFENIRIVVFCHYIKSITLLKYFKIINQHKENFPRLLNYNYSYKFKIKLAVS